MIEFVTVLIRGLSVLVVLLPAGIWHWVSDRGLSRGKTFFGARVEPNFAESNTGQTILKEFRWRLWLGALIAAAVSTLIPIGLATIAGSTISSLAISVAFALAHGRTRRESSATAQPTVRVASLAIKDETEALWLGVLDWLAMLVPPVLPAATLMFLALHWDQMPAGFHGVLEVFPVFFGLMLGLLCTANQWALRFRARSSDWAPTAGASHKYRTYLGAMQALVFAFITCQICVLALMPFNGNVAWLRYLNLPTYFMISFPAQALWLVSIWRMRIWLTNHLATESSDQMSDNCWKWGWVYFNSDDPAMVVPLRTGIGQSFNYASPSVWVVGGAVTMLAIASLVQSTIGLLAQAR